MRVSIALCTFNGAAFLKDQLASYAAQTSKPAELVAIDDGSSDDTVEILENFAESASFPVRIYKNVHNLGVRANFQRAIARCTGDLIALSDQDDVWLPRKLERAVAMLRGSSRPELSLYFCRLAYVDSELSQIGQSSKLIDPRFANAVVENVATGCTVVFGSEIQKMLSQANPDHMVMHDWWLYLLATGFGHVLYDEDVGVLYRQHAFNVAGWKPRLRRIPDRIRSTSKRLWAGKVGMDSLNQAAHFVETYQNLPEYNRKLIAQLIELRAAPLCARLKYALNPEVYRNDPLENFGLRMLLTIGWH